MTASVVLNRSVNLGEGGGGHQQLGFRYNVMRNSTVVIDILMQVASMVLVIGD
jgi:hypothetical protein